MEITSCPDDACRAPAEVVDRWTWASTDGPLEHVRTLCARGHGYTTPVEPLGLDQALAAILDRAA